MKRSGVAPFIDQLKAVERIAATIALFIAALLTLLLFVLFVVFQFIHEVGALRHTGAADFDTHVQRLIAQHDVDLSGTAMRIGHSIIVRNAV